VGTTSRSARCVPLGRWRHRWGQTKRGRPAETQKRRVTLPDAPRGADDDRTGRGRRRRSGRRHPGVAHRAGRHDGTRRRRL